MVLADQQNLSVLQDSDELKKETKKRRRENAKPAAAAAPKGSTAQLKEALGKVRRRLISSSLRCPHERPRVLTASVICSFAAILQGEQAVKLLEMALSAAQCASSKLGRDTPAINEGAVFIAAAQTVSAREVATMRAAYRQIMDVIEVSGILRSGSDTALFRFDAQPNPVIGTRNRMKVVVRVAGGGQRGDERILRMHLHSPTTSVVLLVHAKTSRLEVCG